MMYNGVSVKEPEPRARMHQGQRDELKGGVTTRAVICDMPALRASIDRPGHADRRDLEAWEVRRA